MTMAPADPSAPVVPATPDPAAPPVVADPKAVAPVTPIPDPKDPAQADPDPTAVPSEGPVAEMIKREAQRLADLKQAERDEQAKAEAPRKRVEDTDADIGTRINTVAKKLADTLSKERTDDIGNARALTPDELNAEVYAPVNELLTEMPKLLSAEAFDEIAAVAYDVLPEAASREIADKGLTPDKWLPAVLEAAAPNTKAWKDRETAHEEERQTWLDEGFKLGQGAPGGTPTQRGTSANAQTFAVDGKNAKEVAAALAAGDLDPHVEMRRILAASRN